MKHLLNSEESGRDSEKFQKVTKNRDKIIRRLRESGMRITRQRMIILDVILENDCVTCKEVYYQALRRDPGIGLATVYRMINAMNDIGIMMPSSLKPCDDVESNEEAVGHGCRILLNNNRAVELSRNELLEVLRQAIIKKGIAAPEAIEKVIMQ